MERQKVILKVVARIQCKYSEAFKKQLVREYEQGLLNKDQLMRKYSIGGNSTVLSWCRKYGNLHYPTGTSHMGRPQSDPQQQRIKELEQKLQQAQQKLKVYEKLIEVASREMGADVVKKIGAKLSMNWELPEQ